MDEWGDDLFTSHRRVRHRRHDYTKDHQRHRERIVAHEQAAEACSVESQRITNDIVSMTATLRNNALNIRDVIARDNDTLALLEHEQDNTITKLQTESTALQSQLSKHMHSMWCMWITFLVEVIMFLFAVVVIILT